VHALVHRKVVSNKPPNPFGTVAVAKRQRLSLERDPSDLREKRAGYHGRPAANQPRTCRGKRDAARGWKERSDRAILASAGDRATTRRRGPRNGHGGEGRAVDSRYATR